MGLQLMQEEVPYLGEGCIMTKYGEHGPMTINICQMIGKCVCPPEEESNEMRL